MIIYKPDNTALMSIEVDDESYHFAEIMGRDDVTLYFSLPQFVEFPVGSYITYMAKTYTLYSVDKMHMEHRSKRIQGGMGQRLLRRVHQDEQQCLLHHAQRQLRLPCDFFGIPEDNDWR